MMVNIVKRGLRLPPPSPARAYFSIMMECTPEIDRCHSVSTVILAFRTKIQKVS
jgi:hypothetical protein